MSKAKLLVATAFILAFLAGMTLGLALDRRDRRGRRRSHLARELKLTEKQQQQMRRIWSETLRRARQELRDQREKLREERKEEIRALLSEEQGKNYEAIMERYRLGLEELEKKKRELFKKAREQTRGLLTEKQREKYDRFIERRPGRGHRPGRRGRPPREERPVKPPGDGDPERHNSSPSQ